MPAALMSTLKGIGLSFAETVVLGTLLKEGVLSATEIAKATRMKRPTTYDTLRELSRKGLVSEVRDGSIRRFQSVDPDLLPNYLSRQRQELEKKEHELKLVLDDLRLMKEEGKTSPRVRIFEGETIPDSRTSRRHILELLPEVTSREVDISVGETEVVFTKMANGHKIAISIEDIDIARLVRGVADALEKVASPNT